MRPVHFFTAFGEFFIPEGKVERAVKECRISHKIVTVWRLRGSLAIVAGAFFCGVLAVFSHTLSFFCAFFCGVFYLLFVFWYCEARFESLSLFLLPEGMLLSFGVLFRREVRVEYGRVQFCELVQGPAERFLEIFVLSLHTAGAKLRIEGLFEEEAQLLKKRILEEAQDEI